MKAPAVDRNLASTRNATFRRVYNRNGEVGASSTAPPKDVNGPFLKGQCAAIYVPGPVGEEKITQSIAVKVTACVDGGPKPQKGPGPHDRHSGQARGSNGLVESFSNKVGPSEEEVALPVLRTETYGLTRGSHE